MEVIVLTPITYVNLIRIFYICLSPMLHTDTLTITLIQPSFVTYPKIVITINPIRTLASSSSLSLSSYNSRQQNECVLLDTITDIWNHILSSAVENVAVFVKCMCVCICDREYVCLCESVSHVLVCVCVRYTQNSLQIFAHLLNFKMIYLPLSCDGNCLIFITPHWWRPHPATQTAAPTHQGTIENPYEPHDFLCNMNSGTNIYISAEIKNLFKNNYT